MTLKRIRAFAVITMAFGMLTLGTGCNFNQGVLGGLLLGDGIAGSFLGGTVFGLLLGQQTQSVVIQQNCFQNGLPVDCSQIPGG